MFSTCQFLQKKAANVCFFVGAALCTIQASCKKPDTLASENVWLSSSEFARQNPPVVCLGRLEALVRENSEELFGSLSKKAGIFLCQGAISTKSVDCLIDQVAKEKVKPVAKERREWNFWPFVEKCKTLSQNQAIIRKVLPEIQEKTQLLCFKELTEKKAELEALGHFYTDQQLRNLCAGTDVSTRILRCLLEIPASSAKTTYGDMAILCKANPNPLATACFKEAVTEFASNIKLWELSIAEAAQLCGASPVSL